jgi:addiction module HigA family antidote
MASRKLRTFARATTPGRPYQLVTIPDFALEREYSTMPRPAIHPGVHIADELEELHMSASQLACELGIPANRLTEILRGRRGITADTALRLARWFGTSPELWLNLQKRYELRLAENEHGEEIRRTVKPRSAAA